MLKSNGLAQNNVRTPFAEVLQILPAAADQRLQPSGRRWGTATWSAFGRQVKLGVGAFSLLYYGGLAEYRVINKYMNN